jgi:hypothetical protein
MEICRSVGWSPEQVSAHLAELQVHDLLGMDRATGMIVYAYPFTGQATEHRVKLYGHTLHALCAIVGAEESDRRTARCRSSLIVGQVIPYDGIGWVGHN